jgi:outer membrane protein OmpA-like peptidoglycan-associated protein
MKYSSNNLRRISSIMLIGLTTMTSFAQQEENLVPNGSFEATDGKVKKLGGITSATGWTSPTGMRADLFTPSKSPEINTPLNGYGKEDARDGSNYAGFTALSVGNKVPRSYVMVKLDAPMKKGMKYCVKFYVSLAEASKYSSNKIGANFSKKDFATEDKTSIIDVAHVLHPDNDTKTINQQFSWEEICGTYTAEGGEKYMTIGNFYADDKTKKETNKKSKDIKVTQIISAYYYLDEVSVTLINDGLKCDCLIEETVNEFSTTIYQKAIVLNDKMTVTQKIEAQQMFFAFGKANLTPVGEETLNFILEQMKANPDLKLEIMGHSDKQEDSVAIEKPQYADMSSKRVNLIYNFLSDNGIATTRLISSAVGSEEPNTEINENDDADLTMAKNRRVFFKVR